MTESLSDEHGKKWLTLYFTEVPSVVNCHENKLIQFLENCATPFLNVQPVWMHFPSLQYCSLQIRQSPSCWNRPSLVCVCEWSRWAQVRLSMILWNFWPAHSGILWFSSATRVAGRPWRSSSPWNPRYRWQCLGSKRNGLKFRVQKAESGDALTQPHRRTVA